MIYKPFSIVTVPFPFTDKAINKRRPALVISTEIFQQETGHITLMMITSAKHSKWFGDYQLINLNGTGMSQEAFVRQKIFTLDLRLIVKLIGCLSKKDSEAINVILKKCIAI